MSIRHRQGGGITGTLAPGQVPYTVTGYSKSPTIVQGETALTWDTSTKRMRVGPGSLLPPDAVLHVAEIGADGAAAQPAAFQVDAGAHINSPGETLDVLFNLNRTVKFNVTPLTTQRAVVIRQPTYDSDLPGKGCEIEQAATVAIEGPPLAGPGAVIDNSIALWVQDGKTLLYDLVVFNSADFTAIGTVYFQNVQASTGITSLGTFSAASLSSPGHVDATKAGKSLLTTTNATPTNIVSISLNANTVDYIRAYVVARKSDGSVGASYNIVGSYRVSGGVATLIGSVTVTSVEESGATAWDATFTISAGGVINIQATGAASTTIHWAAYYEVREVS